MHKPLVLSITALISLSACHSSQQLPDCADANVQQQLVASISQAANSAGFAAQDLVVEQQQTLDQAKTDSTEKRLCSALSSLTFKGARVRKIIHYEIDWQDDRHSQYQVHITQRSAAN